MINYLLVVCIVEIWSIIQCLLWGVLFCFLFKKSYETSSSRTQMLHKTTWYDFCFIKLFLFHYFRILFHQIFSWDIMVFKCENPSDSSACRKFTTSVCEQLYFEPVFSMRKEVTGMWSFTIANKVGVFYFFKKKLQGNAELSKFYKYETVSCCVWQGCS